MVDLLTGAGILIALAVATTAIRRWKLQGLDAEPLRRLGWVSGHAAPALALSGIVVAAVLSPTFSPLTQTLSDLGLGRGAWAFNGAMVATGLVALPFGVALLVPGDWIERLAVLALALSMNGLNLLGLFRQGDRLHLVGGVLFYVGFTTAFALYALGSDQRRRRRITLGLAVGHAGIWALWGLSILAWPPTGDPVFAARGIVPQVVGAVVLSGWTVWIARERLGPRR